MKYGARNSLLVAPMPTASTSQVLGNNESFEPFTANVFTRRVLAGEFICINKHLVRDLIALDLWKPSIKNQLVAHNGSVQKIGGIPDRIKKLYKTVWEIPQKALLKLAIARGPYICQSQSLNLYMTDPDPNKISMMHFFGWEKGLKTGQYYFRSRPARDAIKFTVDMEALHKVAEEKDANALVSHLEKIGKAETKDKAAVNIETKKSAAPAGGFTEVSEPEAKKQKTETAAGATNFGDWKSFDVNGDKGDEM